MTKINKKIYNELIRGGYPEKKAKDIATKGWWSATIIMKPVKISGWDSKNDIKSEGPQQAVFSALETGKIDNAFEIKKIQRDKSFRTYTVLKTKSVKKRLTS